MASALEFELSLRKLTDLAIGCPLWGNENLERFSRDIVTEEWVHFRNLFSQIILGYRTPESIALAIVCAFREPMRHGNMGPRHPDILFGEPSGKLLDVLKVYYRDTGKLHEIEALQIPRLMDVVNYLLRMDNPTEFTRSNYRTDLQEPLRQMAEYYATQGDEMRAFVQPLLDGEINREVEYDRSKWVSPGGGCACP